jgi:hypothetical protein
MVGAGMIEYVLRRVGRENHPVCMLGQYRPVAPDTAGHIKNQPRFAGSLERIAHQLLVTPERQPPGQATGSRLKTDAGVLLIVAPGDLKLDGGWGLSRHVQWFSGEKL